MNNTVYCKKCGKEIPDDSMFCPECGTPLSETLYKVNDKSTNIQRSDCGVTGGDNEQHTPRHSEIWEAIVGACSLLWSFVSTIWLFVVTILLVILLVMLFTGEFNAIFAEWFPDTFGR